MAQYAYKYNDVFDDFVVQPERSGNAAPRRAPSPRPYQAPAEKQQPPIRKHKKSKEQVIRENKRKFKIALAKVTIIFALFASMLLVAGVTHAELYEAKAGFVKAQENHEVSLNENNELKQQLNNMMENVNIEKIAEEQLGLVKVGKNRSREVDINLYR